MGSNSSKTKKQPEITDAHAKEDHNAKGETSSASSNTESKEIQDNTHKSQQITYKISGNIQTIEFFQVNNSGETTCVSLNPQDKGFDCIISLLSYNEDIRRFHLSMPAATTATSSRLTLKQLWPEIEETIKKNWCKSSSWSCKLESFSVYGNCQLSKVINSEISEEYRVIWFVDKDIYSLKKS